jgi:hypothetical protein
LANKAEARIIRAAYATISQSSVMKAQFKVIRLVEALTQLVAFGVGTLVVAGFPVKPDGKPSSRELIYVDVYVCPVFPLEPTDFDSKLLISEFFNDLRVLLWSNLPLVDSTVNPTVNVTDAVVDLEWRSTVLLKSNIGRVPIMVARYQKSIDPETGDFN